MTNEIADRAALAHEVAEEAGRLCMRWFRSPELTAEVKADQSPVTRADKESEELIRRRVEAAFPSDAILGEEYGVREGTSGFTWVLDPIDGTRSFVRGIPTFANLIAVVREKRAVVGVAGFPALGETVHAVRGGGAFWMTGKAEREARVTTESELSKATIECVSPGYLARNGWWASYERLVRSSGRVRGWNDAYAFALVATGRIDAAVDIGLKIWDIAPFDVIMGEAGGMMTDLEDVETLDSGNVVVSNGRIHEAVLGVWRE